MDKELGVGMGAKILIVEDDNDVRELLVFNLSREGFEALESADGLSGLSLATEQRPDLILLDVMMPGLDGLSVCRELKREDKTRHIPIIMLTARSEEVDRIVGLELGVDDYVSKPFNVRELMLRVKAILRRVEGPERDAAKEEKEIVRGPISLDPLAHSVRINGEHVEFTATEFNLLAHLMRNSGVVHSREQLLDAVWGYHFAGYARTVDTHIRRVRAKLGDAADWLETLRGVGYRFRR